MMKTLQASVKCWNGVPTWCIYEMYFYSWQKLSIDGACIDMKIERWCGVFVTDKPILGVRYIQLQVAISVSFD